MVFVPMKAPGALLFATLPMKHMAMNEPLARVGVDKTQWKSDHVVTSARTRLYSQLTNKMMACTLVCKEWAAAEPSCLSPWGPFGDPNCAELACYFDLRRTLDRLLFAYLRLHSVSSHLTILFLGRRGTDPTEVEQKAVRGVRGAAARVRAALRITPDIPLAQQFHEAR